MKTEECANIFIKFYSSVFTNENVDFITFAVTRTTEEFIDITFSEELVSIYLAKTKKFSSPEPDGLSYGIFKAGLAVLIPILSKTFQFFFHNGNTSIQWKTAYVVLILKKSNRNNPAYYRSVSLPCCCCKLMESCIRELIWKFWSERSIISPSVWFHSRILFFFTTF